MPMNYFCNCRFIVCEEDISAVKDQNKMGVDINVWRMRIGCFLCGNRSNRAQKLCCRFCTFTASTFVFVAILISLSGDVELNPGPLDGRKWTSSEKSDKATPI